MFKCSNEVEDHGVLIKEMLSLVTAPFNKMIKCPQNEIELYLLLFILHFPKSDLKRDTQITQ